MNFEKYETSNFLSAIQSLPPRIKYALQAVPEHIQAIAQEIRFRQEKKIMLTCAGRDLILEDNFNYKLSKSQMEEIFLSLCGYSIHSCQHQIKDGYLTLQGGHRAGICGTAVIRDGQVASLRDISSINIRIARNIKGISGELINRMYHNGIKGTLVCGAPSSGKTTLLRDLANTLSSGKNGKYYKVALADERGELSAVKDGSAFAIDGITCDVLNLYPKPVAIMQAIRCLSPDVIICDEIGTLDECEAILQGMNSGVPVIASIHAHDIAELLQKPQANMLIERNAFKYIAFLVGRDSPGKIKEIVEVKKNDKADRSNLDNRFLRVDGF